MEETQDAQHLWKAEWRNSEYSVRSCLIQRVKNRVDEKMTFHIQAGDEPLWSR